MIIGTPDILWDLVVADLDGDGDQDVLGAWLSYIDWWENLDGAGTFGLGQSIIGTAFKTVHAADLDGDDDLDLLAGVGSFGSLVWHENLDGAGLYGSEQFISLWFDPDEVWAADLDDDGDQDVLASSESTDDLVWFENLTGAADFGPPRVINVTGDTFEFFTADFDQDGDTDVASVRSDSDEVVWYENLRDDCDSDGVPNACEPESCIPTPGAVEDLEVQPGLLNKLLISYTPGCAASDHTVVSGPLDQVATYGYDDQECGIGVSGTHLFDPGPGSRFFLVVANDGGTVEGSYGSSSDGERPEDLGDPSCSLTQDLNQPCN